MRACACDTASRPCVRSVLCRPAFLLVPPLPSADSAAACAALFAGFAGPISGSDFSAPFIIGDDLRSSRCGPGDGPRGGDGDLPVPLPETSVHASDDAGWSSHERTRSCCLLLPRRHRHPGLHCFRRSIPGLHAPLSTLHPGPHGPRRMTRGRCGSLRLHRNGLSPSVSCRSPGAPWLNPPPHTIAVYASPWSSPSTAQHSLPGGRYPLPVSPAGPRQLRLAHRYSFKAATTCGSAITRILLKRWGYAPWHRSV